MRVRESHRDPVSSYEEAIWALLANYGALYWADDPEAPLPPEACMVADIFWVNGEAVRRDVRKAARSLPCGRP